MRALVLLALVLVAAGCSKTASSPGGNAAAGAGAASSPSANAAGAATAGAAAGGGESPCERHLVSQDDVQPLLSGPITSVKASGPSDPHSCMFATAGFSSISVTLRPDGGRQTLEQWRKGPTAPLPGVGDGAVWEAGLQEVVAARGDALCTVTAMGSETAAATAQAEGAVCNKMFAGL